MAEMEDRQAGAPDRKDQEDQDDAHRRSAIGAHVVHQAILLEGEEELKRATSALAWSGLAAGLSMGFSLVAEGVLRSFLPAAPWRPIVAKLGYSIGFLIVILGRQQLFTENTLTPILPLMRRREARVLLNVLRLWGIVLLTNLLGAALFAGAICKTAAFEPAVRNTFLAIGHEALDRSFWSMFVAAIFAGWLIALMVWLLPGAEVARIWIIIILAYLVGLSQLSHIIAGAVETLYVVWQGEIGFGHWLGHFVVPTLLGNILGGVALVAAVNHAQVVSGEDEED